VSGVTALVAVAVLLLVAWQCFGELPPFGQPLMRVSRQYIETGAADTGATNLVAAILLDFRAYDTLGEATVLFTAVMGVAAVVRRVGRKGTEPSQEQDDV
jgi:multisubunit Na+/H+ antiporter MnhB subunit